MHKILNNVYYDLENPACYSGIENVYREAKKQDKDIKRNDVVNFMAEQETYTLHKPIRRKFLRNKTRASGVDTDWQIDICDLQKLKEVNKGYAYILTVIDVLSRYAWAEPLKSKSPEHCKIAFGKIISGDRKPWRLYSDHGLEFYGKPFQHLLKSEGIEHYSPKNEDIKCAIVERYNRTLKTRMWKLFTAQRNYCWIDKLPDIVAAINNSPHRAIGMAPAQVSRSNEQQVYETLYGESPKREYKFCVGEQVRISKYKHIFAKGYLQNFTTELFTIAARYSHNVPVYSLKDYNGELIDGKFYEEELVKVVKGDDVYRVEKVLQRRTVMSKDGQGPGRKQLFVKWDGYPDVFNQWIDADAVVSPP